MKGLILPDKACATLREADLVCDALGVHPYKCWSWSGARHQVPVYGALVHRHRVGRKTLARLAQSSDLILKRQATWGMSDKSTCLEGTNARLQPLRRNAARDFSVAASYPR
jgi:hypothetical protein